MAVYSIIQQEPEGIPKPITQAASIVVQPESLKNFEYPGTRQGSGILPVLGPNGACSERGMLRLEGLGHAGIGSSEHPDPKLYTPNPTP